MTVGEIFSIKSLKDLKLVAGEKGLDKVIKSVNIMDNPEALDWLSAGEVLLTSGYFFKDSPQGQNEFLIALNGIGCPCLCIKPKRFLHYIPQSMIDIADDIGLPVFEIPYGISFSSILISIMTELSQNHDPVSRKSIEIHNEFFNISLEGGGLSSIAKKLSEIVENPVILLDENWNLLDFSDVMSNPKPLSTFFDIKPNTPFFDNDFLRQMPYDIDKFKKSITRVYYRGNGRVNCRIMPALAANRNYGYIILCQTVRELTEIDFIALENASLVYSMERSRLLEMEQVKSRLKGNFFDELLEGRIESLEEAKNQCELLGINPEYRYYCCVFCIGMDEARELDDMIKIQYELNNRIKTIIDSINNNYYKLKQSVTCFQRMDKVIMLCGYDPKRKEPDYGKLHSFLKEIYHQISQRTGTANFKIGTSKPYDTILSIKKSFAEACETIHFSQTMFPEKNIAFSTEFEVFHFLKSNISKDAMDAFSEMVLGVLRKSDIEHGTNYLETLDSYISSRYNATEAAKLLFIHRNTFFHRIEKIKDILNMELTDADELFKLELALKIHKLL